MVTDYHAPEPVESTLNEQGVLDLERHAFMALIRTADTQQKIREVL
jgi:hypothetical protein